VLIIAPVERVIHNRRKGDQSPLQRHDPDAPVARAAAVKGDPAPVG
jgi:hypothetical protein